MKDLRVRLLERCRVGGVHVEVGHEVLDRQVDLLSGFRVDKPWGLAVRLPDELVAVNDTAPTERQEVRSRVEDVRSDFLVETAQP